MSSYSGLNRDTLTNRFRQIGENHRSQYASELCDLGISTIALNYVCPLNQKPRDASTLSKFSMENRKENWIQRGNTKKESTNNLHQLTRITCTLEDMAGVHSLNSSHQVLKSYDLIAALPETERIFEHLCEHGDLDIITIDPSSRLPFSMRKKYVDIAIKRGITFEIPYAAAISDSTARRYFFANADLLLRVTKGNNIIFSSAASRAILLRSPADLVNIGCLLGMSYGTSVNTLTLNCQKLIEHSVQRKAQRMSVLPAQLDQHTVIPKEQQ